jgi:localization factor PodJL
MKLGDLWILKGFRPHKRGGAETSARSGNSIGGWLNSVIQRTDEENFTDDGRLAQRMRRISPDRDDRGSGGLGEVRPGGNRPRNAEQSEPDRQPREWNRDVREAAPQNNRGASGREAFGDVRARLDTLSQELERLGRLHAAREAASPAASSELSDQGPPTAAPPRRRGVVAETPLSVEDAVAEIAARQQALEREPPAFASAPASPAAAAAPASPTSSPAAPSAAPAFDFGEIERQLRELSMRVGALQPSPDLDQAIAAMRSDLTEIGRQINEALPRRAIEALETEVKVLAERIDHSRQSGVDADAVAGLERGLADVREALRGLTPAENLAGFEEAVHALVQKVDLILAREDPGALQQLEAAIGGLRGVVSHVASNDTLTRVSEDVRALAAQVDALANNVATGHAVSALEQRIDTLAAALNAANDGGQPVPRDLEKLLGGLIEKLEWVQLTHTDHAALAHLEDRIAALVQRFDASDARLGHLEAIERGLADLLVHIEQIRGLTGAAASGAAFAPAASIERDILEIKENDRRTRDMLEAVHGTVEHVVDRLASIENNLYGGGPADSADLASAMPTSSGTESALELPARSRPDDTTSPDDAPPTPTASATSEFADEQPAPRAAPSRPPIDPDLPPDHPLEPGAALGRPRSGPSAAERVAASEAAIGAGRPPVISDAERPNFIAAARRAAQAAAWEPAPNNDGDRDAASESSKQPHKLSERLRKLIVTGSVVLLLLGGIPLGIRILAEDGSPTAALHAQSEQAPRAASASAAVATEQIPPVSVGPPLSILAVGKPPKTEPAPSLAATPVPSSLALGGDRKSVAQAVAPPAGRIAVAGLPSWASPDVTGALQSPEPAQATPSAIGGNVDAEHGKLPEAIDPALRAAAMAGNPAADYEVAMRFAEGRGVAQNDEEAAHWLARAAEQGLAPAQFRLGGFYEKGLGVSRDLAKARDLYLAAAEQGNGEAMHNLAVLYAEGVDGSPDYSEAAAWFRKAADHGIEDSQYNLGILYARGIGVQRSDAESYKWFALAANRGDKQAAKKRDEIASHLSAKSLAAARAAVQKWKPEPQPADAISVKTAAAWASPAELSGTARSN